MPNRIYLTGFMGSGKTTAGKKLATAAGWDFIDLDHEIEKKEGKSISQIFTLHGEDYFRNSEAETLRNLITLKDSVIATGGGTPCFHGNMNYMLATGIVVYLKLKPEEIKKRLSAEQAERPLLIGISEEELLGFIRKKLGEREKYYNMAHIITDGYNFNEIILLEEIKKKNPGLLI
ncbi:MAG TPA: shikimate kinase [Bacteroidales bacterium]|nr:shikimate kinase [Bacteroidales bacterium]HOK75058.1 shikimate kinase [Bacteroidales bacterium]HOM41334.1 shikimate kinase [Bacteroidales bacterium]HPP93105.1 shikimate kinase [Bacteroidales bacterium]HRR16603.1 shikimate kinase [Bacteroidales bacterium]